MALELSLFGGFIVSILPPSLWLPLQGKGFGAGGAGGADDFHLQQRPPPPPAPQLSPCIATQLSPHTQTGAQYTLSIMAQREARNSKPSPHPTPVLLIKRPECCVTTVC